MIDKNDALFLVRLPFGQKTIPYEKVSDLIAMAKSPGYDRENASDHEGVMFALGVMQEEDHLKDAVRRGEVEVLDKSLHRIGSPFIRRPERTVLTVQALRKYVDSIQGFLEVAEATEPQAAPEVHAGASDTVEPAKAGLLPLTTGDIAFCFAGLHWETEKKWKKPLGDKPKWLAACIVIPGMQGLSERRWNPVCIGAALVRMGYAKTNSVRAKFQTQPLLTPWLDEWKTYEADYLDTK